jgi:hypothetical protein
MISKCPRVIYCHQGPRALQTCRTIQKLESSSLMTTSCIATFLRALRRVAGVVFATRAAVFGSIPADLLPAAGVAAWSSPSLLPSVYVGIIGARLDTPPHRRAFTRQEETCVLPTESGCCAEGSSMSTQSQNSLPSRRSNSLSAHFRHLDQLLRHRKSLKRHRPLQVTSASGRFARDQP